MRVLMRREKTVVIMIASAISMAGCGSVKSRARPRVETAEVRAHSMQPALGGSAGQAQYSSPGALTNVPNDHGAAHGHARSTDRAHHEPERPPSRMSAKRHLKRARVFRTARHLVNEIVVVPAAMSATSRTQRGFMRGSPMTMGTVAMRTVVTQSHVAFILTMTDASGSLSGRGDAVVRATDRAVSYRGTIILLGGRGRYRRLHGAALSVTGIRENSGPAVLRLSGFESF